MSANHKRARATGRTETRSFAGVPRAVLSTNKYRSLSGWARALLLEIAEQYTGRNNGDLTASWSVMKAKGWRSPGTLEKARKDLLSVGFISLTRQGGRNRCSLYAVTWYAIDECIDKRTRVSKLDVKSTSVPAGTWRDTPIREIGAT